ncbi:hypothetical protein ACOME3_008611 [Neoechinorhynchus agilis]
MSTFIVSGRSPDIESDDKSPPIQQKKNLESRPSFLRNNSNTDQPHSRIHLEAVSSCNEGKNIDKILSDFSTNILGMVDLRIATAIQHMEKRFERLLEDFTASISNGLSRVIPSAVAQAPVKRSFLHNKDEPIGIDASDTEMMDEEVFVRQIIEEQKPMCSEGVVDLIKRRKTGS